MSCQGALVLTRMPRSLPRCCSRGRLYSTTWSGEGRPTFIWLHLQQATQVDTWWSMAKYLSRLAMVSSSSNRPRFILKAAQMALLLNSFSSTLQMQRREALHPFGEIIINEHAWMKCLFFKQLCIDRLSSSGFLVVPAIWLPKRTQNSY